MSESSIGALQAQLDAIRAGIREVSHELSNRVGVLRMAVYYLQATEPDQEKRAQYYKMMNEAIDKAEIGLRRLRSFVDLPPIGERAGDPPLNSHDQP
jgi:nitrogen-specific signal transduction histidine kinase